MRTTKMTVRLPETELIFAKNYAREHGFSLTGLVRRYISRLSQVESKDVPDEVRRVAGVVPPRVEARSEHMDARIRKHR